MRATIDWKKLMELDEVHDGARIVEAASTTKTSLVNGLQARVRFEWFTGILLFRFRYLFVNELSFG